MKLGMPGRHAGRAPARRVTRIRRQRAELSPMQTSKKMMHSSGVKSYRLAYAANPFSWSLQQRSGLLLSLY